MSKNNEEPRVIPAQLDFLTIYNPTLGTTDETLEDQIVFYYSRRSRRNAPSGKDGDKSGAAADADEENRRLRQVGLAQGMVNLAKNFSSSNIDSVETEKSRIILHELEKDWWILASIDLTRLPAARAVNKGPSTPSVEYSAREVAPVQLLATQLVQANALFLLHHATSLAELHSRLGREPLCGLLNVYWSKFSSNWDVLLHGNPATNIYNATKLSGGGELGIGVGEEEWGSGEREVIEDFVERTEGLRDLIIGRYGRPPKSDRPPLTNQKLDTWIGTGSDPAAADGLIFSGNGLLSRRSLCTVSQWMEAIFKQGEAAYGVSANPTARHRQRRNRPLLDRASSSSDTGLGEPVRPRTGSFKKKSPNLRKQAIENNAIPPGIPAPLVGQVERSLIDAVSGLDGLRKPTDEASRSSPQRKASTTTANESSAFGADNMMKYLTLGYGSSWTLNPKGLKDDRLAAKGNTQNHGKELPKPKPEEDHDSGLQEVDPTPHDPGDEQPFVQRLENSIGRFLIGLSGDLEQAEMKFDVEDDAETSETASHDQRLFLRTLNIEFARPGKERPHHGHHASSQQSIRSGESASSKANVSQPPTSAAASIDGSQPNTTFEKVQVAVYIHQPFIFVFMFELHTPTLKIPAFYRSIHNQLGPLQKPLMRSTDPSKIAARIAEALGGTNAITDESEDTIQTNPIYDLVYDAKKHTVRTSIPNIPIPGSLAAEGLAQSSSGLLSVSGSWYTLGIPIGTTDNLKTSDDTLTKSVWSRTEALNAHMQILNTFAATRIGPEFEQTVKTARGWWVIWMKVLTTQHKFGKQKTDDSLDSQSKRSAYSNDSTSTITLQSLQHKEAILLRRAADFSPRPGAQSRAVSSGPGKWLLREQKRDVNGGSVGAAASAKGVSDGVGIDAKRWVAGLLTLTR